MSSSVLVAASVLADPTPLPISALPAASSVSGPEMIPAVQSGTTKKVTVSVLKTFFDGLYQPLDGDLTAISALSGTHTIYYRSAASTWSAVTVGTGLNFTGATLAANTPTATPTATPTNTPTPTATATPSATFTPTPTPTAWPVLMDSPNAATKISEMATATPSPVGAYVPFIDGSSNNRRVLAFSLTGPRSTATPAPGATPAVNTDNFNVVNFTSLGTAITSMTTSLTGTPVLGQRLLLGFKDDGTPRTITWGSSFQSGPATLLATTATSKQHWVGLIYDGSKWTCFAVDATGY